MNIRPFRPTVVNRDLNQHMFRRLLGVLDEHVEITVVVKYARVEQFVFEFVASALAIRVDKLRVGKRRLRILVQIFHVRVGRRAVQVEIVFLDVFSVVAFVVGQPKQPFLENRIVAVPQRDGEAEPLMIVGNSRKAIFAPAIGARASLVMRKIIPGVASLAVVLADCAPLAFAEVGAPLLPRFFFSTRFVEPNLLAGDRHGRIARIR